MLEIPVKVFINSSKKRDSKVYMLKFNINDITDLKSLREEILNQLGKDVVKFDLTFDVGYFSGSHKIIFTEKDSIKSQLKSKNKSKGLWCEGRPNKRERAVMVIDSDSDCDSDFPPSKKRKSKISALDAKVHRVDSLANELRERHGAKYNKIQYKLWAEALDVSKHESKEIPPTGPIWNTKPRKSSCSESVNEMASAFTSMANTVATALQPDHAAQSTPTKQTSLPQALACISPAKRIDLQQKLFTQIDMLHKMFERGALTSEQYEKRRDDLLNQFDNL